MTWGRWSGTLAGIWIGACAPGERNREHATKNDVRAEAGTGGDAIMKSSSCDDARQAIRGGRFVGWHGLARGCSPAALFDVAFDDSWGLRKLGSSFEPARMRLLELTGYYRPLATVRDGEVVMFDGTNPVLDGGWPALSTDLGTPDASRDFVYGSVTMTGGEHIHAGRGVTIFLNPENQMVVHVAIYVPTTVDEYERRLRPSLDKQLRPSR